MTAAGRHAMWKAEAAKHLAEQRPKTYKRLVERGELDRYLTDITANVGRQIDVLMAQGFTWYDAWEQTRSQLYPEPEEGSIAQMPASEGFKAHRELIQGLNELRMPGEKDD